MELIGEEQAIDIIGEERLLTDLVRRKGEQWLQAMLERLSKDSASSDASSSESTHP